MEDDEWEDEDEDDDEDEEYLLDFDKASMLSDKELTDALEESISYLNDKIIKVELLWRKLEKEKPLVMLSPGLMQKDEMYKAFERRKASWEKSYEKSKSIL